MEEEEEEEEAELLLGAEVALAVRQGAEGRTLPRGTKPHTPAAQAAPASNLTLVFIPKTLQERERERERVSAGTSKLAGKLQTPTHLQANR